MKGMSPVQSRVLDGKRCNELWVSLGSLGKVCAQLASEGVRSNRSGRKIGRSAVAASAWRYCIRNPEETFLLEEEGRRRNGSGTITREQWNDLLIKKSVQLLTLSGFKKFLKENNLYDRAIELGYAPLLVP